MEGSCYCKSIVSGILTIAVLIILSVDISAFDGTGSQSDPFLLNNCSDMLSMNNATAYYKLIDNIDCDSYGEIQYFLFQFYGTLNGNNKTILNMYYTHWSGTGVGIFGRLRGAKVYDLNINNSYYEADGNIGGLAGDCRESSNIVNVKINNLTIVLDYANAGGLLGKVEPNNLCYVDNIFVNATILERAGYTADNCGGLIGSTSGASSGNALFRYIKTDGFIDCTHHQGGLIGSSFSIVRDSYSIMNVTNNSNSGQLFGMIYNSVDSRLYSISTLLSISGGGTASLIQNSFYDSDRLGSNESAYGTPKTTADMKLKLTYADAGWDFDDIWYMKENVSYPKLRWLALKPEVAIITNSSTLYINGTCIDADSNLSDLWSSEMSFVNDCSYDSYCLRWTDSTSFDGSLTVYCNDTEGNIGQASKDIIVDVNSPICVGVSSVSINVGDDYALDSFCSDDINLTYFNVACVSHNISETDTGMGTNKSFSHNFTNLHVTFTCDYLISDGFRNVSYTKTITVTDPLANFGIYGIDSCPVDDGLASVIFFLGIGAFLFGLWIVGELVVKFPAFQLMIGIFTIFFGAGIYACSVYLSAPFILTGIMMFIYEFMR